jgi:hypothetical protein
MLKESPDHLDADLILKIYELRRETVMRESRRKIGTEYWPRTAEEVLAVLKADHPLNTSWRQVAGYWEMVYGMARHGIIHGDFLVENNGEGLMLFAKVEPYLDALRKATSPRMFRNSEWVVQNTELGAQIMESFRSRVAARLKSGG